MPIFHPKMIELRRSDRVDRKPRKEPIRPIWWVVGCAVPIALFSAFVCGCGKAWAGPPLSLQGMPFSTPTPMVMKWDWEFGGVMRCKEESIEIHCWMRKPVELDYDGSHDWDKETKLYGTKTH